MAGCFSKDFPPNHGLNLPSRTRASLVRILLETGIALTPAESVFSPAAWFAVLRYWEAFSPRSLRLRLVPSSDEWDPRLVTILAEELAVGVANYLAREYLGVIHVADVAPLLHAGDLRIKNPPFSPKHPGARPDFLGVLSNDQAIVFEAKGAVGTRSRLTKPLQKGHIQVRNVDFVAYQPRTIGGAPACDRMVFGTHFCTEGKHPLSETTTVVLDPPGDAPEDRRRLESDLAVRVAYAKIMNLADLSLIARNIVLRRGDEGLDDLPLVETGNLRLRLLGLFPWGVLVLDDGVAQALRTAGNDLRDPVSEALRVFQPREREVRADEDRDLILLNNGVGLWRKE